MVKLWIDRHFNGFHETFLMIICRSLGSWGGTFCHHRLFLTALTMCKDSHDHTRNIIAYYVWRRGLCPISSKGCNWKCTQVGTMTDSPSALTLRAFSLEAHWAEAASRSEAAHSTGPLGFAVREHNRVQTMKTKAISFSRVFLEQLYVDCHTKVVVWSSTVTRTLRKGFLIW